MKNKINLHTTLDKQDTPHPVFQPNLSRDHHLLTSSSMLRVRGIPCDKRRLDAKNKTRDSFDVMSILSSGKGKTERTGSVSLWNEQTSPRMTRKEIWFFSRLQ